MAVIKSGESPFQAYARLISILGDQLISDKWVGVIELVKNSYDADAENVFVRFNEFEKNSKFAESMIEIEDDGKGMTLDTILNIWMKPATPNKLNLKKQGNKRYTEKGRVMQGDKGVGRFAVYKLGYLVEVYTKTIDSDEVKLTLDFKSYADDDLVESDPNHVDKYLEEILNKWEVTDKPQKILNEKKQGTLIRISKPRDNWKKDELDKLAKAFSRIRPPQLPGLKSMVKDFDIKLTWNDSEYINNSVTFEKMFQRQPFSFEGSIDKDGNLEAIYKYDQRTSNINFNLYNATNSYDVKGQVLFKERFITENEKKENIVTHRANSGGFMFFLYAFDLNNPLEGLTEEEKIFLKQTSVYLYRDNIRVYPYGELGDDWLKLSKLRGERKAGDYFSYNDLIGFIFIEQAENPKLRDAADREGLMNIDGAKDDFVALVVSVIEIMKREVDFDKENIKLKKQKDIQSFNIQHKNSFNNFKNQVSQVSDKEIIKSANAYFESTNKVIAKYKEQADIYLELAGTGMAVEKATHDTMSLIKKLRENTDDLIKRFNKDELSKQELRDFLKDLEKNLLFLYQELQVLQPLFRQARKITKDVSVKDVVERVLKLFRRDIEGKINVIFDVDKDIVIRTNTGLLMQVILNLMDNAIYWTKENKEERVIQIKVNSEGKNIIFADNGIGIDDELGEVIFKEFYSRKADGRGLGLYIARELLERINADISVVTNSNQKILKGANFIIQFKQD